MMLLTDFFIWMSLSGSLKSSIKYNLFSSKWLIWVLTMSNKKEYLLNLSPKSIVSSRISNMYACMQSRFSCVQFCVPRRATACQAPLSMGLSRQEYIATHSSSTQGTNPSLLHLTCTGRQVLYHQHHWGSPGSLTWSNPILGVKRTEQIMIAPFQVPPRIS